jgi:flagellar hook assembly protein FlgD
VIVKEPNPLNKIKITVFTVAGELIYRFPQQYAEGIYQQTWDGRNEAGKEAASGIYLLKVDVGGQSQIVKAAKVK